MEQIKGFFGKYRFLSNFYLCNIKIDQIAYPSSEHAYQAHKTRNNDERLRISTLNSPSEAKKEGRLLTLRGDWDPIFTMHFVVKEKFLQNDGLKLLLLHTENAELIEENTWNDTYWGTCNGKGSNYLGHILMTVRKEFQDYS